MIEIWRAFWKELNTPDDYHADPYGGGKNQVSHVAIGAFLAGMICVIYGVIFNEMPYKTAVLGVMAVFYGFGIEVRVQESSLSDGLADTAFLLLGACAILFSFTEVAVSNSEILLKLNRAEAALSLVCIVLALVLYILPRAVRKYRGGR